MAHEASVRQELPQPSGFRKLHALRSVRRTRLRSAGTTRLRTCFYSSSFKMEFEINATSRGFPCIVLGAFKYRKIRETADGEIVWRCTKKSCLAQVRTNLEQSKILNVKDHHDHVGLDPYKLHRIKHQQSGRPALPSPGTHYPSRQLLPELRSVKSCVRHGVRRVEVLHQTLRDACEMQPLWTRHVLPRNNKSASAYWSPFWVETAAQSVGANLQRLHKT